MAVPHPGGTIAYGDVPADTIADLIANARSKYLTAGWTSTDYGARTTGTFTGLPSDGQTITIDGTVYTARTSVTSPTTEFAIGASANDSAANLATLVANNHPTFTATVSGATVTFIYRTGGTAGNGKTLSESLSNFTLSSGTAAAGGYVLLSALAPDGNQHAVRLKTDSNLAFLVRTSDGAIEATNTAFLTPSAGRTFKAIVHRYGAAFWLPTSIAAHTAVMHGHLKLFARNVAPVISDVNDNGGEFEIVTASAHNLATGHSVFINGTGVSGLDGQHVAVTVIDPTTFTIDGSTYAGGWSAGTPGRAIVNNGIVHQIGRAFFCYEGGGPSSLTWRDRPTRWTSVPSNSDGWLLVNNARYQQNNNSASTATPGLVLATRAGSVKYGGVRDGIGCEAEWPMWIQNEGPVICYGLIYGLMLFHAALELDEPVQQEADPDHDYVCIGTGGGFSLLMATN